MFIWNIYCHRVYFILNIIWIINFIHKKKENKIKFNNLYHIWKEMINKKVSVVPFSNRFKIIVVWTFLEDIWAIHSGDNVIVSEYSQFNFFFPDKKGWKTWKYQDEKKM